MGSETYHSRQAAAGAYSPGLTQEALSKAGAMMELMPDGQHVRIFGLNKTYDLDDLIPNVIGPDETLGKNGVLITVVGYIFVSIIGALGNALVLFTIFSRPKMRIMRHVFIANLAASDFVLCSITTPLTLLEVLGHPIGTLGVMCKIVQALQATSVYVSTLSITAIALERYKVIVYSINPTPSRRIILALMIGFIWLISMALSMPFVIFRTSLLIGIPNIRVFYRCTEVWPITYGRALYSIFCMVFQYCMPSFIIGIAHVQIVLKLRHRFSTRLDTPQTLSVNGHHTTTQEDSEVLEIVRGRRKRQRRRQRKTNLLLCIIALIFAICWLPLNVVNIIADFSSDLYTENQALFQRIFVGAHLFAMSSAVTNPILYGFLNENFRKEFQDVFLFWVRCLCGNNAFVLNHTRLNRHASTVTEVALKDRHPAELTAL
ncbi:neuropeptide F receptor-like [Paramacrobiotus metropolitanus]|uniref:neuropeptide F receptor-like n=1 Tax=Paramacrobiotus metropolitanus TaxID=2943436 RepID=UPI002445F0F8|nr:neuropeptide F receptor-like [Paramacrobiotus metropolitanus]XP_055337473.1 neuropeptide F receptor-like [Paramacrobiotus metropolitanus]